jgi:hypothetical protein
LRVYFARFAKTILDYAQTEEGQHVFDNIRTLRNRFEPEVVAKEKASRSRRAKVAKGAYRARATDASCTKLRLRAVLCPPDLLKLHILQNIGILRERFEPEVLAKEKPSRPRRAKVAS